MGSSSRLSSLAVTVRGVTDPNPRSGCADPAVAKVGEVRGTRTVKVTEVTGAVAEALLLRLRMSGVGAGGW